MMIALLLIILLLLYLFMICPRLLFRPDYGMFKRQCCYAHRGLHNNSTDAPENSMKAFQKAIDAGYGIELDVQLSKDRVPVVFHDDTLNRVCGTKGTVDSYTVDELQRISLYYSGQYIPKLEDVLKLVDGKVPLIVEFKMEERHDTSVCEIAAPLLDAYQGEYCIESFNPKALIWYRKNRPKVIRGQLAQVYTHHGMQKKGKMRIAFFAMAHLLFNFLTKPDFIAYDCRDRMELSRNLCRSLFRCISVAWTVKSSRQLIEIKPDYDVFIFEGFHA